MRSGGTGTWDRGRPPSASASLVLAAVLLSIALVAGGALADEDEEDDLPRYWEVHAGLLSLATGLFVLAYGILVLRFIQAKVLRVQWVKGLWFARAHNALGAVGAALGAAGIAVGYYMVDQAGTGHARLTHSLVGFLTLALIIAPIASGAAVGRAGGYRTQVRWWHIVLGLAGIAVMLVGAATGWEME